LLLTALLDGERVDATTYNADSLSELQKSEERKRMVMPVCGVRAVAKARGETTRFFAHLRKAGCKVDPGGESPQHLAMKESLKDCIDQVPGWHAIVKHPHRSREWIIDVLAESDDFRSRVAFEVRLSSQTPDKYFARSQRYFDSSIFPVWLVPRQLEYQQTKVPMVVTGFGKSSPLPEVVSELLALPAGQDFVHAENTLGDFVASLLRKGLSWAYGTPQFQADAQKAAAEAAAFAAEAERRKQGAIEQAIGAMNDLSASPESAFGPHVVRTRTDATGARKGRNRRWGGGSPPEEKLWPSSWRRGYVPRPGGRPQGSSRRSGPGPPDRNPADCSRLYRTVVETGVRKNRQPWLALYSPTSAVNRKLSPSAT
jgi:hypothetical protein